MALSNATPTLWSKMILRALDTLLVFNGPGVINRDYEGQIQTEGDSVKIVSVGDPEVRSYTKNTDITGPDNLIDASQVLLIDQADYLNWQVDGIDLVQVTVDVMAEAARRSAYRLRKKADEFTAKKWEEVSNKSASEVKTSTSEAVYNQLVEAGVILDENDTPDDGSRFVVIPPSAVGSLQRDIRFIGYGTQANRAQLERGLPNADNGLIGEAAGFRVFQSNQVAASGKKFKCIAGHPMAWTFADQILNTEVYKPEKRIGASGLKALHVYGGKVTRPSNLTQVLIENA